MSRECADCGADASAHTGSYCHECGGEIVTPEDREPSDDELYNGFGMEGGIPYSPEPALDEHDWRL